MSRKHYNAIADALVKAFKSTYPPKILRPYHKRVFMRVLNHLFIVFESDNSAFDRDRFIDYFNSGINTKKT